MIDLGALQGHVVLDGVNEAMMQVKGMIEEIGRGGRKLSDFEKGLKSIGESAEKLGKDLTTKVTLPITALGGASFKLAADFQETLSKTDAVFKDTGEAIKDWSKDSIQAMGMAQMTALDMVSGFGAMGSSIGLMKEDTDEYAKSLTQLAADLSSFHNMSLDQVKTALNGIYTGETESLKQLGIAMTVTNLEAFALTQGIEKQWKEMTQAEQVALRYDYVMNATKDAQGDFARTSDSAANQVKILVESLKELGVTFGEEIIPYITPIVTKLNELIQQFSELDEETKQQIIQYGLLAAAAGPTAFAVGKITSTVGGLLGACKSLSLFLSTNPYAITIAALGALAVGATAIVVDYLTYADKVEEKAEQTARKIEMLKKGIFDTQGAEKEIETLEILILQYDRVSEKVESCRNEEARLENTLRALNKQREEGKITQDEYNQKYYDTMQVLEKVQYETGEYHYSLDELGKKLNDTAGGVDIAREYVEAYANAISTTVLPALTQQQQQLVATANIHAESGKAVIFNSSQQAKAEIDNIYAVIQALEAKQKAVIAEAKAGGAYEEELREAEAVHTAINEQITALENYKTSVQSTYDALIVSESGYTEQSSNKKKERTKTAEDLAKEEARIQEEALRQHEKLLNEESKLVEESYNNQFKALEDHHKNEQDAIEDAYDEQIKKVEAYCKERYETLETEYNGEEGLLTDLYDKLDAFDEEDKKRRRDEKEQSYKDKIASAEAELSKAESVEERQKLEKKLLEEEKRYKDWLKEEELKAQRQAIVDEIEATKSEYDEKKKTIAEEEKKAKEEADNIRKKQLADLEEQYTSEREALTKSKELELRIVSAYATQELEEKKKSRDELKAVQEETTKNNRAELEQQLKDMQEKEASMRQAGTANGRAYGESFADAYNEFVRALDEPTQPTPTGGRQQSYYGSHANGIGYVPFDGYKTELHQGERVLNVQENAQYSFNMNNTTVEMLLNLLIQKVDRLPNNLLKNERLVRG